MPVVSDDVRNAQAATLAALLRGTELVLLTMTETRLAVFPLPPMTSKRVGVLEPAQPFSSVVAIGTGQVDRYEVRRSNGLGDALLAGSGAEIKVEPADILKGGYVFIDSFFVSF